MPEPFTCQIHWFRGFPDGAIWVSCGRPARFSSSGRMRKYTITGCRHRWRFVRRCGLHGRASGYDAAGGKIGGFPVAGGRDQRGARSSFRMFGTLWKRRARLRADVSVRQGHTSRWGTMVVSTAFLPTATRVAGIFRRGEPGAAIVGLMIRGIRLPVEAEDFALRIGSAACDVCKRTEHPCSADCEVFGRRIGVFDDDPKGIFDVFSQQPGGVRGAIDRSGLGRKAG